MSFLMACPRIEDLDQPKLSGDSAHPEALTWKPGTPRYSSLELSHVVGNLSAERPQLSPK